MELRPSERMLKEMLELCDSCHEKHMKFGFVPHDTGWDIDELLTAAINDSEKRQS
jgi:hypothetical protein